MADAAKGAQERSGEGDGNFVDEVAGGDAVLCLENRKLIGAGRQARLLKADKNEVSALGQDLSLKSFQSVVSAGLHADILSSCP
jgi:hypothetical protein